MNRRVLQITAVALLLIATAMIVTLIATRHIHVISRTQRPLHRHVTVTQLTVQIGEGRTDITAIVMPANQVTASLLDQPDRDPTHRGLTNAFGDAIVAINGSYFDEKFEPVGLYVLDGREISPRSRRAPLSAVICIDFAGGVQIPATMDYKGGFAAALQAGPFVIDPGGSVGVTEQASARAKRTILAETNRGELVVLSTSETSLFEMAKVLSDAPRLFGCDAIDRAVNLDGGPSTTLLVRGEPLRSSGGPVRNYLIFSPAK